MTTDSGGGGAPRMRFTLKQLMIFVGVLGVVNAVTAVVMRGGYVKGTEEQLRRWTHEIVLGVNLATGFCVAYGVVLVWLSRRAGIDWNVRQEVTPTPEEVRKARSEERFSMFLRIAWIQVTIITDSFWIILTSLVIVVLIQVQRYGRDRVVRERMRRKWEESRGESVFTHLVVVWGLGSAVTIAVWKKAFLHWGLRLWFPIPPGLLIMIVGMTALAMAGAWLEVIDHQIANFRSGKGSFDPAHSDLMSPGSPRTEVRWASTTRSSSSTSAGTKLAISPCFR